MKSVIMMSGFIGFVVIMLAVLLDSMFNSKK